MINTSITLDQINDLGKNTLIEHIGIEFTETGKNYIKAKMPVDQRTVQPMGLLHGGASAVLIETLGSVGSTLCVEAGKQAVVGIEINVNHLKSARNGYVYGTATLVHEGRTTHVWQNEIKNEDDKLVAVGRLTVIVKNL